MPGGNRRGPSRVWLTAAIAVELASCDGAGSSGAPQDSVAVVEPSASATTGASDQPLPGATPSAVGAMTSNGGASDGGQASVSPGPSEDGGSSGHGTSSAVPSAADPGATVGPTAGAADAGSGGTASGVGDPANGGSAMGTAGNAAGGTSVGGTSVGGASVGGASVGGASVGGASGGGSDDGPVVVDVDLADSIPDQYRQPAAESGEIVKRAYPCYHYTDETEGLETEPSNLVLSRRDEPITKELNVYLPPGYSADEKYPVVYVLHGLTDFEDTWLERGDPHPSVLIDNLIAQGEIRPILAVFPNGNSSSTFTNRTFENQAGYYYFANELVNDVIPFVESEYSVESDRDFRAICGFSMGAMQAINVGLCQSLEHFAWFGAFAAAPTTYTADRIAQYLTDQDESGSYPVHFFYNICGASDMTSESHVPAVDGLAEASEHVTEANLAYHEVPGGHDYNVSSVGLYNLLRIAFAN